MSFVDRVVDNEFMQLILETKPDGSVYVHAKIFQWSKSLYEQYLLIWGDVLAALRKKGIKRAYAHAPVDDIKVLKFQVMFGFNPIEVQETVDGTKYYLSEVTI